MVQTLSDQLRQNFDEARKLTLQLNNISTELFAIFVCNSPELQAEPRYDIIAEASDSHNFLSAIAAASLIPCLVVDEVF